MQAYQQIDIEISDRDEVIERYIKERDELIARRAAIAESELAEAVAKVNALGGYATVEPQKKSGTPRAPSSGPKKYRDPATGAEWSGQGGRPEWLLNQDKEQFLNPAWLANKAAKNAKTNISDEMGQVVIDQQGGPARAEPEYPASISLVHLNANLVAEQTAVPASNEAPIVVTTNSPASSQHASAPQPINSVTHPLVTEAA